MSKINDALDDGEYELVVEALSRLRQVKVEAWRGAQQLPVAFTRADFGIDQIDAVLKKLDVTIEHDSVPDDPAASERDALAQAIGAAAVKAGIVREDVAGLTGPQLVALCNDMASALAERPRVGIRVEGGAIQSVFGDRPIEVDVISYEDEEDRDPDKVFEVEWEEGKPVECMIEHYDASVMLGEFPAIDRARANGPVQREGNTP